MYRFIFVCEVNICWLLLMEQVFCVCVDVEFWEISSVGMCVGLGDLLMCEVLVEIVVVFGVDIVVYWFMVIDVGDLQVVDLVFIVSRVECLVVVQFVLEVRLRIFIL